MWPRDVNDVMHQKRARRILGIWKKVSGFEFLPLNGRVEFLPRKKKVDFRSSPRPCGGCCTWWWWGANGKVIIERLCLFLPYVEKPFNPKVIKSFILELRSRKCFLCFGIPMLSIYELWTFYVRFTYSCMAMLYVDTVTQDWLHFT